MLHSPGAVVASGVVNVWALVLSAEHQASCGEAQAVVAATRRRAPRSEQHL